MSKQLGNVRFEIGEKVYTFRYDFESLEFMEENLGVSVDEFEKVLKKPGLRDIRIVVQAGLLHQKVTAQETRELLTAAAEEKRLDDLLDAIEKAIERSLGYSGGNTGKFHPATKRRRGGRGKR
jgi:hypothetical protein